ncbi:MAG: GntP family permease [Allobranchiibius sp.]
MVTRSEAGRAPSGMLLSAVIVSSAAPSLKGQGLPRLASALRTGIFTGYVFVIPGLAAISITGLLNIKLGSWLLFGLAIGPLTAVLTTFVMRQVLRTGYWKPETDEETDEAMAQEEVELVKDTPSVGNSFSLGVLMLPIVIPLVMIAFGAFAELFKFSNSFIAFLGDANVALFVGLLGAYGLSRAASGTDRTAGAMQQGFHTMGDILLITGVGGSLGAVIKATGLDRTLADLFSADAGVPIVLSILLAWFVAAVLHLAIGSVSVAAITAAGIIAPSLGSISVSPIGIGLAIASGSMFALQVNSNFFWMFKSLLGLSTKGTLKTLTAVTTISSLISLPLVIIVGLVLPT